MSSNSNINHNSNRRNNNNNNANSKKISKKWKTILAIIALTLFIIALLFLFKPEAQTREIPETVVTVEAITAKRSDYRIKVNSTGTVEAETQGNLVTQIRGEIMEVSNNFKNGGRFQQGETLIKIDPRDYQAALSQASANLSQAQVSYSQELANSQQAKTDWERLGNKKPAPDLVLRKPQLNAARALLQSAKANHETAALNLQRTEVKPPYDGRIIRRNAVLGQYVSIGTPLAEVYSTEGVEIRLPISQHEYEQLGLDSLNYEPLQQQEDFTKKTEASTTTFNINLHVKSGQTSFTLPAQLSRTDSAFDLNTRQIDVIASVQSDDTSPPNNKLPKLNIGQFVSAKIFGKVLQNVYVIPNKSIREGSYVYLIKEGYLQKQKITITWQDDSNTIVTNGINNGDAIVTTSLNSTLAGAKAKIVEPNANQGTK